MCLPIETETLFLETISIKNAKAMLLPWHLRRMQETQREIFGHSYLSKLSLHCPCLLYTSPSPRDGLLSRMPSSA